MSLPIPLDDPTRTSLLVATGLLDPAPAEAFDRVTALTARLLNAPISLVSVVVHDRQFFKSAVGLEFRETRLNRVFANMWSRIIVLCSSTTGRMIRSIRATLRSLNWDCVRI